MIELVLVEAAKRVLQRRLAEVAEPGEAVAGLVDEAIILGIDALNLCHCFFSFLDDLLLVKSLIDDSNRPVYVESAWK